VFERSELSIQIERGCAVRRGSAASRWVRQKSVSGLLEELIERGASVFYFRDSRRSLALDGFASLKKRTLVAQFLLWDALGYRFPALKSGAGIKAHAVLAGMQIAVTLGALSVKRNPVNVDIDHCST
jgi:hypothetical protein